MGRFRFSSLSVKLQVLVWVAIIPVFWLVNSYENALASTKDVKQQGPRKFVIASSDNFPPVNMLDKDGNLTGFGRDLSTAVIRAIGGQTNYIHSPAWSETLDYLNSGRADFIHDTAYAKERDIFLDFSDPILEMKEAIIVRSEQYNITGFESLKGKKVACVNKHITHLYLMQFPEIRCHIVKTPAEGLYSLISGDVDAFVYPEQIVAYLSQELRLGDKIKVTGEPLRTLKWSMAVREGDKELLSLLNEGIRKVRQSGEYESIYNRWFGKRILTGYSQKEIRFFGLIAVLLSLAFGISIGLFILNLRLRSSRNELLKTISWQKKAEEALGKSDERFHSFMRNFPGLAYMKDSDGRVVFANEGFSHYLGLNPAAMPGKTNYDLFPAEFAEKITRDDQQILESGHNEIVEEVFSGRHWVTYKFPIPQLGALPLLGGLTIDITERKLMEEAFIVQGRRFEAFFESTITPLAFLDKDFNFIRVNKAYADADEKEISYFPGRNHFELYPSDAKAIFDEVVRNKTAFQAFALPFIYPDHPDWGVTFWDWTLVPMLDNKGEVEFLAFSLVDITEKKKLEAQLRQSQKMEAVGQIAGGIAHDFNNILTAIIGYASITQMKMREDDPLRHNVDQVLVSAERAANLTQGLLAFSRKQISNPTLVNLNELIEKIEKFLRRVIGEDIEFQTILTDKDITVMADHGQIDQALMNLATNARDAMPKGGLLTIETGTVEIDEEYIKAHGYGKAGTYALISVTDSGIGMDEKTREKIFEPFFTTKEVGKGTGLGLSIVYGIIKQHAGYINCYSEPGKGTTFRIYLPLIKTALKEVQPVEVIEPAGGTETILLAEDEENVRELTRIVLEEYGYKVIEAIDGEDAVNKFMENKDRIGLLLLDVIMPQKSGKEAYDRIAKIKPGIKVLFTSGYPADFIHREEITEQGLTFVSKPISPTALLKKVREVLDKR